MSASSAIALAEAFAGASGGVRVRRGITGAALTTMHVGGELPLVVEPQSAREAARAVAALLELSLPYRILGAGSNVIIGDGGIPEWVIRLGAGLREVTPAGPGLFWLGGASSLMSVSRQLCEAGFSGLEFAGGIPASIGGAARMNAGAHGGEMAAVIAAVEGITSDGTAAHFESNTIQFSYRRTSLPEDFLITRVLVRLIPGAASEISARRSAYLAERKARQPLSLPSSGSVFKNPRADLAAGKLIEEAGLKGTKHGGAQISPLHGNWIVNPERRASFKDVCALIELCQGTVSKKFSVELEPEVITWA
jgi:UDP-N-acetylmuramate dehydrogenase